MKRRPVTLFSPPPGFRPAPSNFGAVISDYSDYSDPVFFASESDPH